MFAELDDRLSRLSRTPAIAVDLRGVSSNSLAAALDEAAIHERIGRLDTDPQFRRTCTPLFRTRLLGRAPHSVPQSSATTSTRSGPRSPWNNALVNARTNAGEPPSACLRDCVVDQTRDLRPVGAASSHGVCQSAMRPLLRHGWRAGRHAMMMMSGSAPAPVRAAGGGASPVKHWDDLRHRVMNDMGAMDPATLAQYVHVLASAQELNPQVLDAVGAHVSTSSLELLTPTAIAKILDAFGRYRHRHRDLFRAASHQILVAPGLSAKDALLIVNSCSRTGHKDAQLFECVARCLVGEVDHMQQADLCKCAWAFAKSGLLACLDTGPALLNAVLDRCLVLFRMAASLVHLLGPPLSVLTGRRPGEDDVLSQVESVSGSYVGDGGRRVRHRPQHGLC